MPDEDRIFLRLAVVNKLLGPEKGAELMAGLAARRGAGETPSLAEYAVETGCLTPAEAQKISHATRYNLLRLKDKEMAARLLAEGLLDETSLQRFEYEQIERFRDRHEIRSLLDLMSEAGVLDAPQIEALRPAGGRPPTTVLESPALPLPRELAGEGYAIRYREGSIHRKRIFSIVELSGQLDSHAAVELRRMLEAVFRLPGDRGRCLVLDATGTEYMSSTAIGILLGWQGAAQDRGGDILFVGLKPEIRRVFELIHVRAIETRDSVSTALWSFLAYPPPAE